MTPRLPALTIALAALATSCTQAPPLRVDAKASRIHGQNAVLLDVRTSRQDQVVQMPQMTVNVGAQGLIRTGTTDDAGAFTGWVGECSVEQDQTFIEWSVYERGARSESGLTMIENK